MILEQIPPDKFLTSFKVNSLQQKRSFILRHFRIARGKITERKLMKEADEPNRFQSALLV